jgi:hypothetical protein
MQAEATRIRRCVPPDVSAASAHGDSPARRSADVGSFSRTRTHIRTILARVALVDGSKRLVVRPETLPPDENHASAGA